MDQFLKSYLEKNEIGHVEHKHEAVYTVEESKKLKQLIPGLHCKCLFLKDNNKKFYLVALPAQKRLDIKALRKKLEVKKLNFGSPEELKEKLNLTPGSVSIFGMVYAKDVALIIDQQVWDAEISGFHPNINTSTLELKRKDLEKFYNLLETEKHVMEL
ncbi:MAG: prolyl-tRNA synthetase associated domain-containing protein [archaeon]